jgi:hypothetical protein
MRRETKLISVIVYGRNDSYGYNLHKRAAISLNCIAEVLTHPGDEIIFVDCNTPDDMPTFPEAIQDTLTPKSKGLLRILRLRPLLYEKCKKGSLLKALEPLSRNVALRRSNPSNRWILSTNTDMFFVVRAPGKSLSDVVAELPNGFYELPRFEVPEALWESVKRSDPLEVIGKFRQWGQRLHLNEVIVSRPDIRFDGPGDFQLMLRDQIFKIHGFNEDMILGWHVDSNLCKRLYLLNAKTESLLDHVFAYHCDHTRQSTLLHSVQRTENDANHFVVNVTSPFIPEQAETWGIPQEKIEKIDLTDEFHTPFSGMLQDVLPGLSEATVSDIFLPESYDHGIIYDVLHVFPFLADHLSNISSSADIGYFGGNIEALRLMNKFFDKSGHAGRLLVNRELINTALSKKQLLPARCVLADDESLIEQSDIFIFDAAMMHLPHVKNSAGISFPAPSKGADNFVMTLQASFLRCVESERKRLQSGKANPRKFLLIGSQHTWFEGFASIFMETVLTPYSTHIRHGYIRSFVSPFAVISRVKRQIMRFGLQNKEKIKKRPLLNKIARLVHRRLLMVETKRLGRCPTCGARIHYDKIRR